MASPDRITLTVNGRAYEGWLSSEVSLSLETLAATFSIPVSLDPAVRPDIERQDEVQVSIGDTPILRGYVLAAEPFYDARDCGLRVQGHDRTGDLVRCAALHRGGQWRGASLRRIAQDLCAPFGVAVVVDESVAGAADESVGDLKISAQETVLDVLARAARLKAVLLSRDHLGRLLLTRAGAQAFPGVIQRGVNVLRMEGVGSDAQRHSHYIAHGQTEVGLRQFQLPGDPPRSDAAWEASRQFEVTGRDAALTRWLPLVVGGEGNKTKAELQAYVDHVAAVRRGHSYGLRYTVEGWTWEGLPWPLNARVKVFDDVAGVQGQEWLIASVRHVCTLRDGAVTELLLRPVEAYDIRARLRTQPKHRNWGNRGNTTQHPKGPSDGH